MNKTQKREWIKVKEHLPRAGTPVIGCYLSKDLTDEVAFVVWYDWSIGGDKPIWVNPLTAKEVDLFFWIRPAQWKRFPKPPVIKSRKKNARNAIIKN